MALYMILVAGKGEPPQKEKPGRNWTIYRIRRGKLSDWFDLPCQPGS